MPTASPLSRPERRHAPAGRLPRRMAGWAAVPLTVSVFLLPYLLLASRGITGEASLRAAVRAAVVATDPARPVADATGLADLVATWRDFHLVKALTAALLVVALVALARRVGRRAAHTDPGPRRRLLLAGQCATVVWLLGALTVLLANIQGAVAPLASLASVLRPADAVGPLAAVLRGLRRAVETGPPAPPSGFAGELLGDFVVYHAVFAVLAAVTGAGLLVLAVRATSRRWRPRGPSEDLRRPWLPETVAFGGAGGVFLLLSAANLTTWAHPVPALVASLGGAG